MLLRDRAFSVNTAGLNQSSTLYLLSADEDCDSRYSTKLSAQQLPLLAIRFVFGQWLRERANNQPPL